MILSAPVTAECAPGGTFVVTLTLAGTATVPGQPNADYAIGGAGVSGAGASITAAFPANGLTTLVTISAMPVMDGLAEGSETVTLTVAAGNRNYAGGAHLASGSIADSPPRIPLEPHLSICLRGTRLRKVPGEQLTHGLGEHHLLTGPTCLEYARHGRCPPFTNTPTSTLGLSRGWAGRAGSTATS